MNKELEALEHIYYGSQGYGNCNENYKIVKQALLELKSIKEANLSEELRLVKRTCELYVDSLKQRNLIGYDIIEKQINEALDTIKQALIKAQEPKHYLKWEDLEFKHTPKMFDVKIGDNKYKLVVGHNVAGHTLTILRTYEQQYYFLEADKQFFNDLHLERAVE